ncbi:MAG: hypothetical protein F4Y69_01175 [Chloroflexi bacterium]|nr:hypothetical protein [Chloroflexota bacterium]MYF22558.1 hypothetical protein [Chloroflexota bacterium]
MEIKTGQQLERAVTRLAKALGLEARSQVAMGKRIWGRGRRVDVILRNPDTGQRLGIECKFQKVGGTAEEKIPLTITDIEAWPIRGLVVVHGEGFSPDFRAFIRSTSKVVEFEDLANWLGFFFDLPEERAEQAVMSLNGSADAQTD